MGTPFYLSAKPEFWYGVARLLDLGNTFDVYNECPTGEQADSLGILLDWEMVAQDLWESVHQYDGEMITQHKNHADEAQPLSR